MVRRVSLCCSLLALFASLAPLVMPSPFGRAEASSNAQRIPASLETFAPLTVARPGLDGPAFRADDFEAARSVDPLTATPSWFTESNQAYANYGFSVCTAGDLNGDGYSDIVVGARFYDSGQTDEGAAFVFYGSSSGVSTPSAITLQADQADAWFGACVAPAGDVNADGYDDVLVSAPYYDNGQTDEGRCFLYLGSSTGVATTPAWTAESDQANALLGWSVATAGDVNGDGFADVIIGIHDYDDPDDDEGKAVVYLGCVAGLRTSPSWSVQSNQANAKMGTSVASAGDVNGDGFADVLVGCYQYTNDLTHEGRAYLFCGSATGLSTTPDWTGEGNQAYSCYGISVALAGDVNGDGYGDIIIGASSHDNGQTEEGRAYAYYGSATGLSTTPSWTKELDQAGASFGYSVATAGDMNGDGYADVIIGAIYYDNGQQDEGAAFAYAGSASGLSASYFWSAESDQADAWFGSSVATAGDVNGDGFSDVIVGCDSYDNGQIDEGRAYVYNGAGSRTADTAAWTMEGNQTTASAGKSVRTAGDVNGDGYSDVIVGIPYYTNGPETYEGLACVYLGSRTGLAASPAWSVEGNQANAGLGWSVSTAGDVNGDGYSDVIVGAYYYSHGESAEGAAFVYHGSASGLSTTPAWTVEGNASGIEFGSSVSTAGDVNGDGYADVIVGAPYYGNGQTREGRAYVFLGSSSGLATTPAWTVESDHSFAQMGFCVSTAGDVNGDGYSDVVVGSPFYSDPEDSEGNARVYLGSSTGLSTTPVWDYCQNHPGAFFGYSVSTAGDANGDGYDDVIVGAPRQDSGQTDEGVAFFFLGNSTGVTPSASWITESNQVSAEYGAAVATAGDVNGDGYSDLLVGARLYDNGQTDEGRAYLYCGSSAGPSSTATTWAPEGNNNYAMLGYALSTAGDVNGDGFADVIVGAQGYSNPESGEGKVFEYHGNGPGGLVMLPDQRSLQKLPIDLLGRTDNWCVFGLTALGRSPYGRSRVRLEWSAATLGTSLVTAPLKRGIVWHDSGTPAPGIGSRTPLEEFVSNLTGATAYHWRLRTASRSPFFPHSPWFTEARSVPSEMQVRTRPFSSSDLIASEPATGPRMLLIHPNPFAPHTSIIYELQTRENVRLTIHDVTGRLIALLADGQAEAGRHAIEWTGRDEAGRQVESGVYFARLECAQAVSTARLVLRR
ncbi:MAG: FG-GAP repeat protein [Candidatus Eisenbacteria bacterium]|nr:FG-GAP repeat protein [Candidatus Eisenbacteria bacterium]